MTHATKPFQTFWTHNPISVQRVFHQTVNPFMTATIHVMNTFQTAVIHAVTVDQFMASNTRPATSNPIATTTQVMGFASNAAVKAHVDAIAGTMPATNAISPPAACTFIAIPTAVTPIATVAKPALSGANHPTLAWIHGPTAVNPVTKLANPFTTVVIVGCKAVNAIANPPVTAASRFPIAPSKVVVLFAASTAIGSEPSFINAALNSSAVISPLAISSRKLPVNAPASERASISGPAAPGIALASWFQFSVVSFPAPAVCVSAIPTDRKVSALPPATAFKLPAASASCP